MKKFLILSMLILTGCAKISSMNIVPSEGGYDVERNEDCMDMTRFKVLQVLEDNHALAYECNSGEYCYSNTVVLLTPQDGVDYYDDMTVSLPKQKCAVQDGVYKYETKNNSLKTVPIIRYQYEFSPRSEEEAMQRFYEKMDEMKDDCKMSLTKNKKHNTDANKKKCDCGVDLLANELLTVKNGGTSTFSDAEALKKDIEKQCGKLPIDFW